MENQLFYIDNIMNVKLSNSHIEQVTKIASILHELWRTSLNTDEPYYIKDTQKRSININVSYEKMPAQFTELNKNVVTFTIKLILFGINNNNDCYNLINEYKRLINSSARGSKIDVNFNRLQLDEQRKIIDVYMLCNKIINTDINTDNQY